MRLRKVIPLVHDNNPPPPYFRTLTLRLWLPILSCIALLSVASCESESNLEEEPPSQYTESDAVDARRKAASILSVLIGDPSVRTLVQDEISKRATDENEVIMASLLTKKLPSGLTMAEAMARQAGEETSAFAFSLLDRDPMMSVYLYVPGTPATKVPKPIDLIRVVVGFTHERDEYEVFEGGSSTTETISDVTSRTSIVLASSDRVTFEPQRTANALRVQKVAEFNGREYWYTAYPSPMHIDEYESKLANEPQLGGRMPMRDQLASAYDIVQRIKYQDFPDAWHKSRFELRVRMVGKSAGVVEHRFDIYRHQRSDWVFFNDQAPKIKWKEDLASGNEGDRVLYHFSDYDGGGGSPKWKLSFTAKVKEPKSGVEVSTTVSAEFGEKKDEFLGSGYEYYTNWVHPDSWGNLHPSGDEWNFWINIDHP